jgi:hypothetical protein
VNVSKNTSFIPVIMIAAVFLAVYGVGIAYMFTKKVNGCRRRWSPLDFVWIPIGGLTGILILALWWQSR